MNSSESSKVPQSEEAELDLHDISNLLQLISGRCKNIQRSHVTLDMLESMKVEMEKSLQQKLAVNAKILKGEQNKSEEELRSKISQFENEVKSCRDTVTSLKCELEVERKARCEVEQKLAIHTAKFEGMAEELQTVLAKNKRFEDRTTGLLRTLSDDTQDKINEWTAKQMVLQEQISRMQKAVEKFSRRPDPNSSPSPQSDKECGGQEKNVNGGTCGDPVLVKKEKSTDESSSFTNPNPLGWSNQHRRQKSIPRPASAPNAFVSVKVVGGGPSPPKQSTSTSSSPTPLPSSSMKSADVDPLFEELIATPTSRNKPNVDLTIPNPTPSKLLLEHAVDPNSELACSCGKRFKTRRYLNDHIVPRQYNFSCPICRKQFQRPIVLRTHLKASHQAILESYHANNSGSKNTTIIHGKSIKCSNEPYLPIICHCGDEFDSVEKFSNHMGVMELIVGSQSKLKYSCKVCLKMFPEAGALKQHIATAHTRPAKQSRPNSVLPSSLQKRSQHFQYPSNKLKCICRKSFETQRGLDRHVAYQNQQTQLGQKQNRLFSKFWGNRIAQIYSFQAKKNHQQSVQQQQNIQTKRSNIQSQSKNTIPSSSSPSTSSNLSYHPNSQANQSTSKKPAYADILLAYGSNYQG